jgi:hypothetical protein
MADVKLSFHQCLITKLISAAVAGHTIGSKRHLFEKAQFQAAFRGTTTGVRPSSDKDGFMSRFASLRIR